MTDMPEGDRRHTEAPAEGDPTADASEIRVHSEEPAEGPDFEDREPDRVPPAAQEERGG